jgi:hypothetical protein
MCCVYEERAGRGRDRRTDATSGDHGRCRGRPSVASPDGTGLPHEAAVAEQSHRQAVEAEVEAEMERNRRMVDVDHDLILVVNVIDPVDLDPDQGS